MSPSNSLLRSDGGIRLCPEVCLKVAEELVLVDAKSIKSLLLTSKDLHDLLRKYEASICLHILKREHRLTWVNVAQHNILSSRMPLGNFSVIKYTYPWASEMLSRVHTLEFLANHELTDMIDHQNAQSWPTLDISKEDLYQRLVLFKRLACCLLYRLADCTAGMEETMKIRAHQADFVESLSSAELATLGVIVEVMGQNYFTMTKNALEPASENIRLEFVQSFARFRFFMLNRTTRPPPQDLVFAPSTMRPDDISNDNWIRECMCVFEDLTQRFGPYFPYAFLEGGKDRLLRPDLWAQTMLQEGLDNMNAFELGYTMSFASLQSVVWKVFARKENCQVEDSWNTAKKLVEKEMQGYEIVSEECERGLQWFDYA